MLRSINQFSFQPDLIAADGRIIFAHLGNLATESDNVRRLIPPSELEYVFQLISSHFLHIEARKNDFVPQEHDGKAFYEHLFFVFSLPFKGDGGDVQNEQWNDVVNWVSYDFSMRKNDALRGKCTYEQLDYFIRDHIENFQFREDRERLDPIKLRNLVVFVYDYCMLTMREARLHRDLDLYVKGAVKIRDKFYFPPLRVCAAIKEYEPYDEMTIGNEEEVVDSLESGGGESNSMVSLRIVNYTLPKVELAPVVRNPHASDSNCAAMFVDMMHKFFLTLDLQERGSKGWAKAERVLIFDLLCLFGLCQSKASAEDTRYVTTVINKYGDYFSSCNLRTWIRETQAYWYLMFCSVDVFLRTVRRPQNEQFLSLDCYSEVEREKSESGDVNVEISEEIKTALSELGGKTVVVTNTDSQLLDFASVSGKECAYCKTGGWDPRLDYVKTLILEAFDYITVLSLPPKVLVTRQNITCSRFFTKLGIALEHELLERVDAIPRGLFKEENVKAIIHDFQESLKYKEDRLRFDESKFYFLFLFVFDYVYLSYKEAAISPHLKLYNPSEIEIGEKTLPTTVLADDMLIDYIEYLEKRCAHDETIYSQEINHGRLYVPAAEVNYPIKLSSCNVKNMTAMFYDLFLRFFQVFGLTKRSDSKYLSSKENELVAKLANCCGICGSASPTSVRRMFMDNQDYFKNSSLALSIRENEYGYLLLNTMSDELFGPKSGLEQ